VAKRARNWKSGLRIGAKQIAVTLKITPAAKIDSAGPKTVLVIPEGSTGDFDVVIESSSDMVTWKPMHSQGVTGNGPQTFFRTRIIKKWFTGMNNSRDAPAIPAARAEPTTCLEPLTPTTRLDAPAAELATRSPLQHAVEIIAPIVAFMAVVILTEPIAVPIRQEIPGAIPAAALIALRVWLAYKAACNAARWVAR
jgi:hypothetical protein